MGRSSKACVIFLSLLNNNLSCHFGMHAAVIAVSPGLGEGEGVVIVGVESLRAEGRVGTGDHMRDVVFVGPGYGAIDRNRHYLRAKSKVVNFYFCRWRWCGLADGGGGWQYHREDKGKA